MKSYKRKIIADKSSSDSDRAYPRKAFNSSERWRGKLETKEQICELPQFSYQEMKEIRWNLDEESHSMCRNRNLHRSQLALVLANLEVISVREFYELADGQCTCPDFYSMSDEEVLKRAGYLATKF